MAASPRYKDSARTAQRTSLPTALLLLPGCQLRPIPSNDRCLQSHYLATAVFQLLISRSLPSNGSIYHNMYSRSTRFKSLSFFQHYMIWLRHHDSILKLGSNIFASDGIRQKHSDVFVYSQNFVCTSRLKIGDELCKGEVRIKHPKARARI
jgi:hypothetical protein